MKKNYFLNKKILITGASGSIGSALVLYLLRSGCKVIRALSNDENGLYELGEKISGEKIQKNFGTEMKMQKVRYIYGDVADQERCIGASQGIDIIIHAAALKHVPFCEYNPFEATKTNVVGTENMVRASLINNVSKFLLVSTDKVVDPTSCLGASKLLAERLVINANNVKGDKKTIFACARFGNVIGTRGSILPFFQRQINKNHNLTVTDKKMTRFFMTIEDAVESIVDSIFLMKGNEVFIPKKLKLFKIIDLAESLLKRSGKKYLKIKEIGKRPGEKLFENLLSSSEVERVQIKKNYFIIQNKITNNSHKNKIEKIINNYKIMKKEEIFKFLKKKNLP